MRYVIMMQIVGVITLMLVGASGMFAWLQHRSYQDSLDLDNTSLID
jgi:hypothetical protein